MVTFKYVLIVLRADNQGEGGTFSCYSLLTRYVSNQITIIHIIRECQFNMIPSGQLDRTRPSRSRSSQNGTASDTGLKS